MKSFIIHFIVCVFLAPPAAHAQPHLVDSLLKIINARKENDKTTLLNELGVAYMKMGEIDAAAERFTESLKTNGDNRSKEYAKSLSEIGNIYAIKGNNKFAIDTLQLAFTTVQQLNKQDRLPLEMRLHKYYADFYSRQGLYKESINHLEKSSLIANKLNETLQLAKNYATSGINYGRIADYESSIVWSKKSLLLFNKVNFLPGIGNCYANMASTFQMWGRSDSATYYSNKALQIFEKLNDVNGMRTVLGVEASVFDKQGKTKEALNAYRQLLSQDKAQGLENYIGYDHQGIGFTYLRIKQYDSATIYFKRALANFENAGMLKETESTLAALVNVYIGARNVDSVDFYFTKFLDANASVFSTEKAKAISTAEIKYETAIKETTIAKQQTEINIQKQRNIWLLAGALGMLAVSLVLGLLYKLIRNKNKEIEKQKKIIEGQKAEILHFHDNSLLQLKGMFKRQSALQLDNDTTNEERIKVLAVLHEMLHADDVSVSNARVYITKLCELKSKETETQISCKIDDGIDVKPLLLQDMGIVINELITNAVKHSKPKDKPLLINVKIRKLGNEIHLQIGDNGQGLSEQFDPQSGNGFGLRYAIDLIKQHDGSLNYSNNNGAIFDIKLHM